MSRSLSRAFPRRSPLIAVAALTMLVATLWPSRAMAKASAEADAPVHQLRIYEIFEHNKAAFHARFRDHAVRIMRRHGFEIVAMWEARSKNRTEFVYLLAWPDAATMEARWARFMADQEWSDIKARTAAEYGRLVGEIESRVLRPTNYSPPFEHASAARVSR